MSIRRRGHSDAILSVTVVTRPGITCVPGNEDTLNQIDKHGIDPFQAFA